MNDCELLRKLAYSWAGDTNREYWEIVGRPDVWDEAQQLRAIADKLEKLETQVTAAPYSCIAMSVDYSGRIVYNVAQQAMMRGLEEGEAVPFTVQYSNESNPDYTVPVKLAELLDINSTSIGTMCICGTCKDIEFDENEGQQVVTAIGGIPVVVPQDDVAICPQGHHLKEGNCMRDFCFCQCAKCKADCGGK